MKPVVLAGIGCSLGDYLYRGVDFSSSGFKAFCSRVAGDGGLVPGKLVFGSSLERYTGMRLEQVIEHLKRDCGARYASFNLGGPAIVALVHAAQMLASCPVSVRFYGMRGDDQVGADLAGIIGRTAVDTTHYHIREGGVSPSTVVLSDESYDGGHGERTFINTIGVAGEFTEEDVDSSFYASEIQFFGGTALVPSIHDSLSSLLRQGKSQGALTVVSTVFDYRNEEKDPLSRWPLGDGDDSYRYTDLLVMDREEALRLSGCSDVDQAMDFFIGTQVPAVVITNGKRNVHMYSDGKVFTPRARMVFPVSDEVDRLIAAGHAKDGDTTGCGDNFCGGVLASVASRMSQNLVPDLREAVAQGVCSGGFACFYHGGTFVESYPEEKAVRIGELYAAYRQQLVQTGLAW